MGESNELVQLENLNPVEIFTGSMGIDKILEDIEAKVAEFVPDLSTAGGRKDVASMAYKVSQSKVVLDRLGKDLVADWKAKSKQVDASRKDARDRLDALRDKVRQPLTYWEEAEKAKAEAERLEKEIAEAHDAALAEHSLWLKQKELEAREAELARIEGERKAKELAEQQERERVANEERIRKEAEEKAKREAEEAARQKVLEAERREAEAKAAKERAERERIESERRAKEEQERAVREAEERAKAEADRIERERLSREAAERAEAERKAADIEHRRAINAAALASFEANGIDSETARRIIGLIAKGQIDNVKMLY